VTGRSLGESTSPARPLIGALYFALEQLQASQRHSGLQLHTSPQLQRAGCTLLLQPHDFF